MHFRLSLAVVLTSVSAVAGTLFTPAQPVDPNPGSTSVIAGVTFDGAKAVPGFVVSSYSDDRRQHDLDDIGITVWTPDGTLVTQKPYSITVGRWREQDSSFDCLASGQCLIAYRLLTGPVDEDEVSTFDLNALDAGVTVTDTLPNVTTARVAAYGVGFRIAYVTADGATVMTKSYDTTGLPTVVPPRAVSTTAGSLNAPDLASSGADVLIAWVNASNQQIYSRAVNVLGAFITAGDVALSSSGQTAVDVAVGGDSMQGFAVTWVSTGSVDLVRVSGSGTALDSAPLLLSGATLDPIEAKVVSDGQSWLASWARSSTRTHQQRRVDFTTGALGTLSATPVDSYSLAPVPMTGGIVYVNGDDAVPFFYDGGTTPRWRGPTIEAKQLKLKMAAADGGVYLAWEHTGVDPIGSVDSRGAFIDTHGAVTLLSSTPRGYSTGPAVAVVKGEPLFAAMESTSLVGQAPGAMGFAFDDDLNGGGDYAGVAATQTPAGALFVAIGETPMGDVVEAQGWSPLAVAPPPRDVAPADGTRRTGVATAWASDAGVGLVVFTTVASPNDDLIATWVGAGGVPLAAPVTLATSSAYSGSSAAVASNGSEVLVIDDFPSAVGSGLHDLRAFVLGPLGNGDGGALIAQLPNFHFAGQTALAWDGREYFAAWSASSPDAGNLDLYGLRLASDGTLLDGPFEIAANPTSVSNPAVASPRLGEFVVGWCEGEYLPDTVSSARVFLRRWLSLPLGSSCDSSPECESGACATVCVDGGIPDSGTGGGTTASGGGTAASGGGTAGSGGGVVSASGGGSTSAGGGGSTSTGGNGGGNTSPDGGPAKGSTLGVACGCASSDSALLLLIALALISRSAKRA